MKSIYNKIGLIIIFLPFLCNAQGIKGTVTDINGAPIPYATLLIKNNNYGTTTNDNGDFEIKLDSGYYSIQARSLGFSAFDFNIVVDSLMQLRNIILKEQPIKLHEIRVYKKNEDPAYPIIRRAITMAPYFKNQLSSYQAQVYLKGTAKLKKVPKLLAKSFNVNVNGSNLGIGDLYVGENISTIEFNAPDSYNQKVVSSNMTFSDGDSNTFDIGLITSSIYDNEIGDELVSPLSSKAFSFYNYEYIGYFYDGDHLINKIKIIPKRKGKYSFSGHIYIVDGLWCVQSVELITKQVFGEINIKVHYADLENQLWLPVGHHIEINGKMMGVAGEASYVSSVKYNSFHKNDNLEVPSLLRDYNDDLAFEMKLEDDKRSKYRKKIDEIMTKDELTNRDVIKLSRLAKRESKSLDTIQSLKLEVRDTYHLEADDSASFRNDKYWNEIRPLPLTEEELGSYMKSDSLELVVKAKNDSIAEGKKERSVFSKVIGSKKYSFRNDSVKLKFSGLLDPSLLSFNAVDGVKYAQKMAVDLKLHNAKSIRTDAWLGYSFHRKEFQGSLLAEFVYAPLENGKVTMLAASGVNDIMGSYGISPLINSLSSLFFKENYARYHHENKFQVTNVNELVNGLNLKLEAKYAKRTTVENSTNFSFFKRDNVYYENKVVDKESTMIDMVDHSTFGLAIGLAYTPRQYYKIKDGKKKILNSKWPTLAVEYRKGIPSLFASTSNWDFIEFKIHQKVNFGFGRMLQYKVRGAELFRKVQVNFADYTTIQTSYSPFEVKKTVMDFKLLPYYTMNSNSMLLEGHVVYTSPYLLLKKIPWLNKRVWSESLHLSYLSIPTFSNYSEAGYSIDNLFFVGSVGVFSSFNNTKYGQTSFKFNFRF